MLVFLLVVVVVVVVVIVVVIVVVVVIVIVLVFMFECLLSPPCMRVAFVCVRGFVILTLGGPPPFTLQTHARWMWGRS